MFQGAGIGDGRQSVQRTSSRSLVAVLWRGVSRIAVSWIAVPRLQRFTRKTQGRVTTPGAELPRVLGDLLQSGVLAQKVVEPQFGESPLPRHGGTRGPKDLSYFRLRKSTKEPQLYHLGAIRILGFELGQCFVDAENLSRLALVP